MEKVRAPQVIEDDQGNKYYFRSRYRSSDKGLYEYSVGKQKNVLMVLRPSHIEKQFKRDKKIWEEGLVTQGFFECGLASVSMLTKIPLEKVRETFLNRGWKVEEGASFSLVKKVLFDLGFVSMTHDRCPAQPCLVNVPSLNVPKMGHAVYYDGSKILDPQTKNPNVLWYGPDWGPEEIGTSFITVEKRLHRK